MQKARFNLGQAANAGASWRELKRAERVRNQNERLFRAPGVVGVWVGAKESRPYIMLAVAQGLGDSLKKAIPDALEGISVYYIEGKPH